MKALIVTFILAWVIYLPTAIFANEKKSPPPQKQETTNRLIEDQIFRIDQEILILKAELARQYGRRNALKDYMTQLDKMFILPMFQQRIVSLKKGFDRGGEEIVLKSPMKAINSHLIVTGVQPLSFPAGDKQAVIAVLLPLTGAYEQVGNQLLSSLTNSLESSAFLGSLLVLDTALYESAFDLWQRVKDYEPAFVFGPLRKPVAVQWQALNTGVPTLYFNEMGFLKGHERGLSPSKTKGLISLLQFLDNRFYQNILVLTDDSPASKKLESAFYSEWNATGEQGLYQHQLVDKTVGEAIEIASNIKRSKGRRGWLQKQLGVNLTFQARARVDFDVVISFLSERNAMQVASILDFYRLESTPRVWFPVQTPSHRFLKENLTLWQNSYAILPSTLYDSLSQNHLPEESGLFYALGQVAVDIVSNSAISDGLELYMETDLGVIHSDSTGQFYLLPKVYWMDQTRSEKALDF